MGFTNVVTFGDSLTDTGNGYRISSHTWPPVPPFAESGSYSDGLMWNQILVQQYMNGLPLQDFAYGCATTDGDLVQPTMGYNTNLPGNYSIRNSTKPPGARQQIITYINDPANRNVDLNRTLFALWIGINNYFYDTELTPLQTVQSLMGCVDLLFQFGVQHLLVLNQPPWDRFPPYQKDLTGATKATYLQHNEYLARSIEQTRSILQPGVRLWLFDCYSLMSKVMDHHSAYGFENLENCWDTESSSSVIIRCTDITKRIFADEYHLTSAMQTLIAKEIYLLLAGSNSASTPTSSSSMTATFLLAVVCAFLRVQ